MRPLTLQSRIGFWCALLVALALLLLGLGVSLFLYREAVKDLDRQLRSVAAKLFIQLEQYGGAGGLKDDPKIEEWLPITEPPLFVEIVRPDGTVLYRSKNLKDATLRASPPGFGYVRIGDDGVRVGTFARPDLILRVAGDLDRIEDLTGNLVSVFLIALPILFAFSILGGRWIAQKALTPIQNIAESAEQITAQHLDRRVPVPEARDEVRRLATVLNST